eukprot:c3099_g1_i1.p1 GENE.c3099_g1_i1~~c3099_g1_i1.p1  ORF type:complete len:426 (-),score=66.65 c3099_g1_i1:23-1276(-)
MPSAVQPADRVSRQSRFAFTPVNRNLLAFWLLGLMNNASYVIMNAGATEIASGATGLVYLANIVPSFIIKVSAPYWFHLAPYKFRILASSFLMSASFLTVAFGKSLEVQLLGVCFAAAQSGLGEATLLALATQYTNSKSMLTAWSSGTGMAGVFGYLWTLAFHLWMGLEFKIALLVANILTVSFAAAFFLLLIPPISPLLMSSQELDTTSLLSEVHMQGESQGQSQRYSSEKPVALSTIARVKIVLSLWPYTIPLFLVYASEYMLQAGVWSAIGFPVHSKKARDKFYSYSNFLYQAGVFVSRSSGTIWNPSLLVLWIMPLCQCGLLVFFYVDAVEHFWYDESLLALCVVVGFFGGAVYVNAFKFVSVSVPEGPMREVAMSGASVADTLGIATADGMSLLIQACLYKANHISGAKVSC